MGPLATLPRAPLLLPWTRLLAFVATLVVASVTLQHLTCDFVPTLPVAPPPDAIFVRLWHCH
jgi:hypothetical protein